MQKLLPLAALLFVLVATPIVSAQNGNSNNGECDPSAQWKNHGQYVSCVAHTHPGGEIVSEAAQSDIGKKNASASPSPTPEVSPSPSASPEISPSPEVSPSPEASASPEASPSPSVEPSPSPTPELTIEGQTLEFEEGQNPFENIIAALEELIERLRNLL